MPTKRATLFNARTLLSRLGVTSDTPFGLADVITPVSLVDTDVPLTLTEAVLGTPASGGELLSPAANAVLADTGALAADNYQVAVLISGDAAGATASFNFRLQHRDAPNAANIWAHYGIIRNDGANNIWLVFTKSLAQGERIRVLNVALNVGQTVQANIWTTAV